MLQNAPRGAFCNTLDLHFSYHLSLRYLSIFEWPFFTGFTVLQNMLSVEVVSDTNWLIGSSFLGLTGPSDTVLYGPQRM